MSISITAVLNLYRRPHTLIQQLNAVQNQSFPPEKIIIWKNYAEGANNSGREAGGVRGFSGEDPSGLRRENVSIPEIPVELKHNVTIIESTENFGVWARFTCGLLVKSEYICVFDDDTIPGKFWFESCMHTMKTHCGLLGTIGLRFLKGDEYIHEPRIGWHGPNNTVEQVDIVGHAWFFRQEWTHYLFECLPDYKSMFLVGEDIGFSYVLQKHGINTYVPPHPLGNIEMWGSHPQFAMLYGTEHVAISMQSDTDFNRILKYYIDLGFVTMNNRVYNDVASHSIRDILPIINDTPSTNSHEQNSPSPQGQPEFVTIPNMKLQGNMREHLLQVIDKIKKGEHFGLIRPSDGEYLILENCTFTNCDNWTNHSDGILRTQLLDSMKIKRTDLYIGIPCNTCGHSPANIYDEYINKYQVPIDQLTYANIFCNSNWQTFTEFLRTYEKGFYLITNGTNECEFPIKERLYIDKYLVNNWDSVWESETNHILEYVKGKTDELICFAAGPLSKVWIPKCMEINPANTYLDIGSALDYYTKGTENARPYTDCNSQYSKECCNFLLRKQIHSNHLGNYYVPDNAYNGVCVDIGGNTGQFSLKYKDFFSKIHIYEPQLECFEIIKNNTNSISNIVLYDEAVYNESGLYVDLVSHGSFDSGSVAVNSDKITVTEWTSNIVNNKCKTISLSDIIERAGGYVDYMKIDCETSEYNLLIDKDLRNIKYMGIELHWQIGKENFDKLISHILKYFNNVHNHNLEYPNGYNIEVFFESKVILP